MSFNLGTVFAPISRAITPPPLVQPVDYDGLEYRWKFFIFRPQWLKEQLQLEIFLIPIVLFYVAFIFYGKSTNSKRANAWFETHLPLLQSQFSKPTNGGLTQDGNSDFFNFSTGRRGITSLHTVFTLRPRHDFVQIAWQFLWGLQDLGYRPADEIELDFRLADGLGGPDFVFAVVSKEEMVTIRDRRWDLTFTKTTENASLPPSLSVMSEFADVTEQLFDKLSLAKILSDPEILPYFRSLSVTDQPRERPYHPIPASERRKHIILTLTAPPPSRAADILPLIKALFGFIDALPKVTLRPETRTKLKKTREEVDKAIKEDGEKEKKDELAAEKSAAKKKAEEERISQLSAAEQKKVLERERKRATRKQQGKSARK